jgi:hypothetical protein
MVEDGGIAGKRKGNPKESTIEAWCLTRISYVP